jgi:PKD repeat protein
MVWVRNPTDIDGDLRDAATPDIGADEFSSFNNFSLGPDLSICANDSVYLFSGAAPGDTVLWSNGATTPNIWVTSPGSYSVSINGACGSAQDDIQVNQSAEVYAGYLTADNLIGCEGDTLTLMSTDPYDTYAWTPGGQTTQSIRVTTGGTYTLDVSDNCGAGSESITVAIVSPPVAGFTATNSFLTGIFTDTSNAGGGTPTYSWDFGDGSTSTLQNPNHIYAAPGSYSVTLTVTNECGTDVTTGTVTVGTVGLSEELASRLSIIPNPSNGRFEMDLDLDYTGVMDLRITNVLGEVVWSYRKRSDGTFHQELDLSGAASGVYFLRIQMDEQTAVKRIVIR